MISCPFCDGQGIVVHATVKKINRNIHICDECDTMWLEGEPINAETCKSFDRFMKNNGLEPLWSELTNIERD
ncbi:MAG: hypothetical protein AB2392_17950 [Neobacillus sp.]